MRTTTYYFGKLYFHAYSFSTESLMRVIYSTIYFHTAIQGDTFVGTNVYLNENEILIYRKYFVTQYTLTLSIYTLLRMFSLSFHISKENLNLCFLVFC